jgi:exodeoxyribonuclease VIII
MQLTYENCSVPDMPAERYHAIEALSSTVARDLLSASPMHALHRQQHRDETPAMRLGTALHSAVLEPERRMIAVAPDVDRRTKDGKARYEEFLLANAGKITLTAEQGDLLAGMLCGIRRCKSALSVLNVAPSRELSLFAREPAKGVLCKARIDALSVSERFILDVKSTSGVATTDEFERAIAARGYGFQAAFYMHVASLLGYEVDTFAFVVVESEPPHGCAVFMLEPEVIDLYMPKVAKSIETYAGCVGNAEWPGYEDKVRRIGIPAWQRKQLLDGMEVAA